MAYYESGFHNYSGSRVTRNFLSGHRDTIFNANEVDSIHSN
jgi:hypothetical protein